MIDRVFTGTLSDGSFGMRVSRAGYSAQSEALGSANISFDTRLQDIGTVIAAGLIQCGAGPVYFPGGSLDYVPLVQLQQWNGSSLMVPFSASKIWESGQQYSRHQWYPAIAKVTTSSVEVIAFTLPYYSTTSFYNPSGLYFVYSVFASRV